MIYFTNDEQRLIDNHSTRLIRRVVQEESPLADLVYRIIAVEAYKCDGFTLASWRKILDELDKDERTLYQYLKDTVENYA